MAFSQPESLLDSWQACGLPFRARPELVRELHGGRSNRNYLIRGDGQLWVLRLDAPAAAALGVDREREHRILQTVARAGLAPPVLCADATRGFLVSAYIEGRQGCGADLDEQSCAGLLALLAEVHELCIDVAPITYRDHIMLPPPLRNTHLAPSDDVAASLAVLEQHAGTGLCHHDPVPANVLFCSDRVVLLDWEYAAPGLPLIDLAAIVIEWQQAPQRVAAIMNVDLRLLHAACTVYRALCACWEARVAQG